MTAANVLRGAPRQDRRNGGSGSPGTRLLPSRQRQFKLGGSSNRIEADHNAIPTFDIGEVDVFGYRNTYKHNVCVEMLKEGHHESFREVVSLIECQKEERERLGRDSGFYYDPLLESEEPKLKQLKVYLSAAEDAKLQGDMEYVFESLQAVAAYFEKTGDTWLGDHFHKRCLETSREIKNDERRKEAEAHCNMGLSHEAKGVLSEAVSHFEQFYALSNGKEWYTQNGQNFETLASDCLCRIYTTIAEEVDGNSREVIDYLLKAYEMAKAVDSQAEALASYRLGSAFESTGDSKTAINYHKIYLEKCKHNENDVGLGAACQALARSYESLGDLENAARYLEMYVEVTDRIGEDEHACQARNSLGVLYNTLGEFRKAVECFSTSYESAKNLGDKHTLAANRVHCGASAAHRFLAGYSSVVGSFEVSSLLTWKDKREQVSMIALETDAATIQARKESSPDMKSSAHEVQLQETVEDVQVDIEHN